MKQKSSKLYQEQETRNKSDATFASFLININRIDQKVNSFTSTNKLYMYCKIRKSY